MNADGDTVIAWQDGGEATNQNPGVYAQLYNSSGWRRVATSAVATIVKTNGVTPPTNPALAMEPDGDFVVAWQYYQTASGPGNDDQAIAAEAFSATGSALTGVIDVSAPANMNQLEPSVATDSNGNFVVAWSPPQEPGVRHRHAPGPARQCIRDPDRAQWERPAVRPLNSERR